MANILAELVAKITADTSGLVGGLAEAEKALKKSTEDLKTFADNASKVGKIMAGVGAAISGALAIAVTSFTKTGSELNDLALKTGVSVEALAGLKYAAEQNGASLGTVEMAMRRVAMAMSDVQDGLGESTRAFSKLGLSLADLQGLNPEEQFLKIASAIASIPDPMQRAAIAVDLFGRSGTDMLPMLSEGAAGLQKMMAEGQKLTGWTAEGAKSADAFGDSIGSLKASISGLFNVIGSELAPILKDIIDGIKDVVVGISDWAKANPGLFKAIVILAAALGVFLTVAGTALMALAPLLSILTSLTLLAGAGGLIAGLGAIAAGIAAIAGPVLIVIGIIAALAAIAYLVISNWQSIVDFFKNLWANIVSIFKEHWEKILIGFMPFLAIPLLVIKHWDAIVSFFRELPGKIAGFFAGLADRMKAPFITAINWIVDKINWLIAQINKISPWDIGLVKEVGSKPNPAEIPGFAKGGITTKPTLAMLSENFQPEAVVPLGASGIGGGNTFNITIEASGLIESESTLRQIGEKIYDVIIEKDRRATARAV